ISQQMTVVVLSFICSLSRSASIRTLHSFPTRRSSDLDREGRGAQVAQRTATDGQMEDLPDRGRVGGGDGAGVAGQDHGRAGPPSDRKSTRLNSSHRTISYAVFCLKKKNIIVTMCALSL